MQHLQGIHTCGEEASQTGLLDPRVQLGEGVGDGQLMGVGDGQLLGVGEQQLHQKGPNPKPPLPLNI